MEPEKERRNAVRASNWLKLDGPKAMTVSPSTRGRQGEDKGECERTGMSCNCSPESSPPSVRREAGQDKARQRANAGHSSVAGDSHWARISPFRCRNGGRPLLVSQFRREAGCKERPLMQYELCELAECGNDGHQTCTQRLARAQDQGHPTMSDGLSREYSILSPSFKRSITARPPRPACHCPDARCAIDAR